MSLAPQPASTPVNELSTCYANFSFLDQFGNPYTPSAVSYRIDAPWYNAQVADWAAFSGTLGPTIQIPITSAQNAKQVETDPQELRKVTIRITLPGGGTRYDRVWYTLVALPEATLV
jgi:hypothetical protein